MYSLSYLQVCSLRDDRGSLFRRKDICLVFMGLGPLRPPIGILPSMEVHHPPYALQ
ncbi:hypothetical protein Hanom_Chr09g00846191 [Helianthus anomalus]